MLRTRFRVEPLFIDAAAEIVRGCDVELPQVLGLPWGERFRVHRLDVRQSKQGEHLQALRGSQLFGQFAYGLWIIDVASPQGRRQLEMVSYQEGDRVGVFGAQAESLRRHGGQLKAAVDMVSALQRFAGVMQQKGKIQQLGTFQLAMQSGKRLEPLRTGIRQVM